MERTIHITHFNIELKSLFEDFTRTLENSLGKPERSELKKKLDYLIDAETESNESGSLENLVLYHMEARGSQHPSAGLHDKVRLYELGNPIIAEEMASIDIRAGLYYPLRLLVYVAEDNGTYAEYDLPSTLFDQFSRNGITQIGHMLDTRMKNLIQTADRNERYSPADAVY